MCSLWSSYLLISPTFYPVVVLLFCIVCYPVDLLRSNFFKTTILYCLILFIIPFFHRLSSVSFSYGSGDYNTALIESAFILPSVAISSIIFEHKSRKELNCLAITGLLAVVVSLCFMIPYIISDNNVIRLYSERANVDLDINYTEMAVARYFWNYPMCHAIVLLFPIYIALFQFSNNKNRFYFALLLIAVLYFIIQSSIATTIFFSFVCIVFIYNKKGTLNKNILYTIEIIILFLSYLMLPFIIDFISNYFKGSAMEMKLQDIYSLLQGGSDVNGSFSVRSVRHHQAMLCFLNNPLLGDYVPVNGHSVILNRLGSMGLIGIIPFCLIFYQVYHKYKSILCRKLRLYYYLAFACCLLLVYTKGIFGQEGYITIFVVVPVTLLWLQAKIKDTYCKSNRR